jgi:hypothetical protein
LSALRHAGRISEKEGMMELRGLVAMLSIGVVVLASAGVASAKNEPPPPPAPNPPLTGETFTGSGFPNGSRDCANHAIKVFV